MFQSDSRLLSESRWLVTPGFMTVLHLSKQFEQSNYPLLSPGCRNEGLTHLDCLKGSIAVQARDTFSPIVTFPLVSLNLAEPPTTCCHSLFFAGPMCQWSVNVNSMHAWRCKQYECNFGRCSLAPLTCKYGHENY